MLPLFSNTVSDFIVKSIVLYKLLNPCALKFKTVFHYFGDQTKAWVMSTVIFFIYPRALVPLGVEHYKTDLHSAVFMDLSENLFIREVMQYLKSKHLAFKFSLY